MCPSPIDADRGEDSGSSRGISRFLLQYLPLLWNLSTVKLIFTKSHLLITPAIGGEFLCRYVEQVTPYAVCILLVVAHNLRRA